MPTSIHARWWFTAMLASGLTIAATLPAPARASDDLVRVLVDVADVIYHGGQPYYRYGDHGRYDRVVIVHDRYRRPSYYRYVPRYQRVVYHQAPPPHAHGYYRNPPRYYDRRARDRDNDYRHGYGHGRKSHKHDDD
jgi:hypothetical protein